MSIRFFSQRIGIHARIMSAAVILICATVLTLGYFGVTLINGFLTQRFNQRIHFMTQYLALNSELGILIDEQTLLKGLAANMLKEDDIRGVEIQDRGGRILVNEVRQIKGPFDTVERKVFLSNTESSPPWITGLSGNSDHEYIGLVRVTYSIQGIEDLMREMTRRFVATALVLTILAGMIFYFISRSLVSPVISLAETARKISMGNRTIRAQSGTTPEIAKLADAFNEMLDSLARGRKTLIQAHEKMTRQETLAEVGKFSMMIAHEVKNPLGIIKSALEMLKTDLNIPRDNIPLNYAEEEIVRLNTLIESFLIFSKPARPKFEQTDLNRMVEQVIMGFEIQHGTDQLEIVSDIPAAPFTAKADFDLLSRGIGNIIKNACEANKQTGKVAVTVQIRGNKWILRVRDQGPGIKAADKKHIFEPFFTTKAKGTGLGLAFADQVVKAHGGSITTEDAEGRGACFVITLFSGRLEQQIEAMEENGRFTDR